MVDAFNTYKFEKGQLRFQLGTGKRWSSPKKAELQPEMLIIKLINSTVFTVPTKSKQNLKISDLNILGKQVCQKHFNVHLFSMMTITSNRPTSNEFVLHII